MEAVQCPHTLIFSAAHTSALRTSYTKGYAPLELQSGKLHQLGPWSDVFSLGAVLFSLLWKRTPIAFDCEMDAAYNYDTYAYAETAYQDRFYRVLTWYPLLLC